MTITTVSDAITVRTASFVCNKHMGKFSAPMEYKLMGNLFLLGESTKSLKKKNP
jgi:hypothetical protein